MAKSRMINTRFWNDGYVSELEPMEKLLFLYFLTNSYTSICGIYELPLRTIAFETGIEEERVRNILARFALDEKIRYEDGWVIVKNFAKHQQSGNPKIAKGIEIELRSVPQRLIAYIYPIDSLSHPNTNSNPNSNPNADAHAHRDWLNAIPEPALKELSEKYEASPRQIARKGEELHNYCLAKGKTYKNYRAFLENALNRDFGRRLPRPVPEKIERRPLTDEELAALERVKAGMKLSHDV